jgi:hypothetical protein
MNSPILCLVVILIVIIIIIVIVGIANYSTNNTQCNNFKNNKFQNGITTPPAVCTRPISTTSGNVYSCASNYIMPNTNGTCPASMITLSSVCAPPSYSYSVRNQFFQQYSSANPPPFPCSNTFIYGNQVYPCISNNIIHAPGGGCPNSMVNAGGFCIPASGISNPYITGAISNPYITTTGAISNPYITTTGATSNPYITTTGTLINSGGRDVGRGRGLIRRGRGRGGGGRGRGGGRGGGK